MNKFLKVLILSAGGLILIIAVFYGIVSWKLSGDLDKKYTVTSPLSISADVKTADMETGRRIATVRNGCVDCHYSDLAALIAYLRTVPAVEKPNRPISIGPLAKILYFFGKLPTLVPATVVDLSAHRRKAQISVSNCSYVKAQ